MLSFQDALHEGDAEVRLRAALLVYHGPSGAMVTAHDVDYPEGGSPQLLAGYPITREQADLLARLVQGATPTRTVLPENVVMWDGLRVAWWTPSRRGRIWFCPKQQPHLQHVSRQEVTHPALLWVADPKRLHVYALAEGERPTAATPIYQAPYLNVYADGWVCAEGFDWPGTVDPDCLGMWEKTFLDSEGTKVWAHRLTLFPGGHDHLWEAMRTAVTFPSASLVPTGLTVLDAINRQGPPAFCPAPTEEIVPIGALTP